MFELNDSFPLMIHTQLNMYVSSVWESFWHIALKWNWIRWKNISKNIVYILHRILLTWRYSVFRKWKVTNKGKHLRKHQLFMPWVYIHWRGWILATFWWYSLYKKITSWYLNISYLNIYEAHLHNIHLDYRKSSSIYVCIHILEFKASYCIFKVSVLWRSRLTGFLSY